MNSGEKAILESDVLVFCAVKEEEREGEGKEEEAKEEKDDTESWGQS